jgi:hypothetical protein
MHNAQPWRFRYFRGSRTFQVRADFERSIAHADAENRALHLGCGAALLNLRVAAAHAGWQPVTRLLTDPGDRELLATVHLAVPEDGWDDGGLAALHPAIPLRHTSRHPFAETPIPDDLRAALTAEAEREGTELVFPTGWHLLWVLELIHEAEARNRVDPGSEKDMAAWVRPGATEPDAARDGIPEYAFGPRVLGGKAPMRDFARHWPEADQGAVEFEHSPHLALLSTSGDGMEDWLHAGQAMERVLLLATLEGLAGSFLTQAVEWPDIRWPLRDPVAGKGNVQTVLRLGYGPAGPGTPRRPLGDVLTVEP